MGMVGMTLTSAEQTTVGLECLGFHFNDISSHNSTTTEGPSSQLQTINRKLHGSSVLTRKCI